MRRLLVLLAGPLLIAAPCVAAHAAGPRVGPGLSIRPAQGAGWVFAIGGRRCRPVADAPASVLVTVGGLPGKVFTATPDAAGRWSVDVELPGDGTYLINAECDDYYGTMTYPQETLSIGHDGSLGVLGVSASNGGAAVAATGSRTGTEVGVGAAAVALGALLVWAGRPRRKALARE